MKKVAVVTGATSGIGLEISIMLLEMGYRIFGIGRNFPKTGIRHEAFVPVVCDLSDPAKVTESATRIRSECREPVSLLVNNAGIGAFGPHEAIGVEKIHEMLAVNLEAPLLLTRLFMADLKRSKGFIINMASVTALKPSPMGSAYSATKAGLLHFSRGLFEETRKSGVRVVSICPDMTKTGFFRDSNIDVADDPSAYLTPGCVAGAIKTVLEQPENAVMTEIVLRPQRHRIKRKGNKG